MTRARQPVGIRLSAEDVRRLDHLVSAMAESTGLEVTRTDVHRAALARGLEVLEQEHGKKPKR